MSYSVCIIGNSHIAAIKQAWTNRAPAVLPGVSITFFSAGTHLLMQLELDGTLWRPKTEPLREKLVYTSDGKESIELSDYDIYVVVGTGFGLDASRLSETFDIASATREPEGDLLSRACFAAMVEALLESSLAVRMIDTIKSVSGRPVLVCAAPYLSERLLSEEEPIRSRKKLQDLDFLSFLVAAAKKAGEKVSGRHGFALIWQKNETVGVPGFTKASYGLNPIRFTMKGSNLPPVDRKHGNEDYGFIMLNAILHRLHELSGGKVLPARSKTRAAE